MLYIGPMRAVIQRVDHASVTVEGEVVGSIEGGLVVLLGVTHGDTLENVHSLVAKIVDLRIFEDDDGRFNRSLRDVNGALLVVSQFTLYGDIRKGRRPSFTESARPEVAEPLIDAFASVARSDGFTVETGRFGAMMDVDLRNSGPFTLILDARDGRVVSLT